MQLVLSCFAGFAGWVQGNLGTEGCNKIILNAADDLYFVQTFLCGHLSCTESLPLLRRITNLDGRLSEPFL